jgi:REP element-mobilizing transposase RayT
MANYNTFVVVNCKTRKPVIATSSARKAYKELQTGIRVEVWNNNVMIERIYESDKYREGNPMKPYIDMEREYIRKKQEMAEQRNKRRKSNGRNKHL